MKFRKWLSFGFYALLVSVPVFAATQVDLANGVKGALPLANTAKGTAGYVLTGNGASAPSYQAPTGGALTVGRTVSGTTDTLTLADAGTRIATTSASAVTITVPINSSVDWTTLAATKVPVVTVLCGGAGMPTIIGESGVSIAGTTTCAAQDKEMYLEWLSNNTWNVEVTGASSGGAKPAQAYTASQVESTADLNTVTPNTFNSASATVYTVQLDSAVSSVAGDKIYLMQLGAGKTTVTPASGVTVSGSLGYLSTNGQYSVMAIIKSTVANLWYAVGNRAP